MNVNINPKDSSVKILVVEDDDDMRELILKALSKSFPLANIHGFKNFGQENFEEMVIENKYTLITIDGFLGNWKEHPIFYVYGARLVSFVKEKSPETIIVGMSSTDDFNEAMMEAGALVTIKKGDFLENGLIKKLFNSDLSLKEMD